jgi:hypothetical protein
MNFELEINMDFNQAMQFYTSLKLQYDQGRISAEEFEKQANEVVVTDENGAAWQIGVSSGQWYRYDGRNWVEDTPPGIAQPSVSPAPIPPPPPQITPVEPRSRSFNWLWLVGGLAALAIVVCIVGEVVLFIFNQKKPLADNPVIPQPVITQPLPVTPRPVIKTPTSGQTALPGFDLNSVFKDDFSNPASGWDRLRTNDGITDYENGKYRISVNKTNTLIWATPRKTFNGEVGIEVDATKAGGPDKNEFGVICRYQDADNYYRFMISSDGYAVITRIKDGQRSYLSSDKMQPSEAIHQGAATNHIRADCAGTTLTLEINQQKVASATDISFSSGDVGLVAGTYETPGVNILFDNFFASP